MCRLGCERASREVSVEGGETVQRFNNIMMVSEPSLDDAGALADALRRLHADRTRLREMGERARRLFLERFDAPIALAQWMDVLANAAGAGAGSEAGRIGLHRFPR